MKEMGVYIVEKSSTVSKTAERFGVSKSTVHKDLTVYLKKINFSLYNEVQTILQKNKSERHLRGGLATKLKYQNNKKAIEKNKSIAFQKVSGVL